MLHIQTGDRQLELEPGRRTSTTLTVCRWDCLTLGATDNINFEDLTDNVTSLFLYGCANTLALPPTPTGKLLLSRYIQQLPGLPFLPP